jgi:hypothetical protein
MIEPAQIRALSSEAGTRRGSKFGIVPGAIKQA